MTVKQYIFPLLCLIFFTLGAIIEYNAFLSPKMEKHLSAIEQDLHQKEQLVYGLTEKEEKGHLDRIIKNNYKNQSNQQADLLWLNDFSTAAYTFHLYQSDSLVFWSNNHVQFNKQKQHISPDKAQFIELGDGSYELIQFPIELDYIGTFDLFAFIPIKHQYNLESKYLNPLFVADQNLPQELELSSTPITGETPLAIKTAEGTPLCYLTHSKPLNYIRTIYWMFFAYFLGAFFLFLTLYQFAEKIIAQKSVALGVSFLLISVFSLGTLSLAVDFSSRFQVLKLFERTPDLFFFGNSLGDFIFNICLMLGVIIFLHKHIKVPYYGHLPYVRRYAIVLLNSIGIVFFIAIVALMLKELIFSSNIPFNFDNVFSLESNSLFAIGGVILMLISLFLMTHLMMIAIKQNKFVMRERYSAYALALLSFIPMSYYYELNLISYQFFLFLFTFIVLYDIFIGRDKNSLIWLVAWLVLLSGFSSALLYGYNQEREQLNRLSYVENLLSAKDTIFEAKISQLENKLLADPAIEDFCTGKVSFDPELFYNTLDEYYSNNSYLYNNYVYSSYFLDENNIPQNTNEQYQLDSFLLFSVVNTNTANNSTLYLTNFDEKGDSYFLKIPYYPNGEETTKPHSWLLEFYHKQRQKSSVYNELLQEQSYKNMDGLATYDYATYKGENRTSGSSRFSDPINYNEIIIPAEGTIVDTIASNLLTSTYFKDNKFVILQKDLGGYLKQVSLFSFVFALLILFVFLFSMLNTLTPIFPNTLNLSFKRKPSLRGKMQLYVIGLVLVSFILIGVVTVIYFNNSNEEYHENRLARKTESVIKGTERELELLVAKMRNNNSIQTIPLEAIDLKAISKIHRMDINLYDASGELVQSSEMDIYRKEVVSKQMNAVAFQKIGRQGASKHIEDVEYIGALGYKSAYIPLRTTLNMQEVTIGYLGLPYYSKESSLREDVTVFMGTLLNVYVFLLFIAGAMALAVSNSITRPIVVIGEKLKQFKLGGRNEPLEWRSNDELGVLIDEYNRMVLKIQESADGLAQSEREGAWREMAKQVAHEIKNPLTPMKLSIQYLQHAYKANPSEIEPLLKRVSNTLIEQIDNLAQIASEFSSFAKMPRAENQRILLNNLVGSVYDLFKEDPISTITLDLPEDEYYVYADKNHLIRVFNNLIKNATQAIPDGREGAILVHMFTEKGKILVEVKDNGTGITDEMKEKVFVPNFTTKNSGTGLGLAISKNIIESVNGEIYFTTKVGKGTSFFVKLPIIDVKKAEEILVS